MPNSAKIAAFCICGFATLFLQGCDMLAKAAESAQKMGKCLNTTVADLEERAELKAKWAQDCNATAIRCNATYHDKDVAVEEKRQCDHALGTCACKANNKMLQLKNPDPADELHECCEAGKEGLPGYLIGQCHEMVKNMTTAQKEFDACCNANKRTPEACGKQASQKQGLPTTTVPQTNLASTFQALAQHLGGVEAAELYGYHSGDAESEERFETMTWGIAGVAGGSITMMSAVIGFSAFNKKYGVGTQPLLA